MIELLNNDVNSKKNYTLVRLPINSNIIKKFNLAFNKESTK